MTRRQWLSCVLTSPLISGEEEFPDIRSIAPDLVVPVVEAGPPGPKRRVAATLPEWAGSAVHHTTYLPADWRPGKRYPVLVEYAGNGGYHNAYGDVSTGEVEGSKLGYGLSGGSGFLWLCLPYVNARERKNETLWWGDIDATAAYCRSAVKSVCSDWGGDPDAVVLCGFSRGSIGCNFIGLHDDETAKLWRGFFCYSHYDGVRESWPYPGADRASALRRLQRLAGRPQFICHERSVAETQLYLHQSGIGGDFTFESIRFRNHNDAWTLREIPSRQKARQWLHRVLQRRTPA